MARFSALVLFIAALALTISAAPTELSPECKALKKTLVESHHDAMAALHAIPTSNADVEAKVDEVLDDLKKISKHGHAIYLAGIAAKAATDEETADKEIQKKKEHIAKIGELKEDICRVLQGIESHFESPVKEKAADAVAKFKAADEATDAFEERCSGHHPKAA